MLGTLSTAGVSSTYSNTEAAFSWLETPLLSLTVTTAGPAPSSGRGEPGGSVAAAGGNTTLSFEPLVTAKLLARVVPTCTLATRGSDAVPKPDPDTVTV